MPEPIVHIDKIFEADNNSFSSIALQVFEYQSVHCKVYKKYLQLIGCDITSINDIKDIPFLPIELFTTHDVCCDNKTIEKTFRSSGTTGQQRSKHHVADLSVYKSSIKKGFENVFGPIADYCILGLLPSYIERNDASLVYMVDYLMKESGHNSNAFYLDQFDDLNLTIQKLQTDDQRCIVFGVTFALLDWAEKQPIALENGIIIETGGMKGRRKELTRDELHQTLSAAFQVDKVGSEYGMTELLSQAYSLGDGKYTPPPWMQISIRDPYDPFTEMSHGKNGGINIIDLANINSCSFIATQDIGLVQEDGSFEVRGRLDNAAVRGCNLMVL